ncbi:MAG: glucose-6-phosphate isomerase [Actinomycetales bacterium]|nr:glucose-6-phosphate isomerase [Actinomycetales bacterium]
MTPEPVATGRLVANWERLSGLGLAELLADPDRGDQWRATAGPLTVDAARDLIDEGAFAALAEHLRTVTPWLRRFLAGEAVNSDEQRAAAHWALRARPGRPAIVDRVDVSAQVAEALRRMTDVAAGIRSGRIRTPAGRAFTSVISVGIGGSDLGPAMAAATLGMPGVGDGAEHLPVHFCANVDPVAAAAAVRGCDPATTLIIVASKTFTTVETMANAALLRTWLADAVGGDAAGHLVAVTAAPARAADLGIAADRIFPFWDWVGGRFSLASAISLPLMIGFGPPAVAQLRAGMCEVDEEVRATLTGPLTPAALHRSGAVLHGLLWYWYHAIGGLPAHAVIPYSEALARLPAYLQQLVMESNGKSTTLTGQPVATPTAPVVFGEPGTNAQHSFFQLLHQGTHIVPVDIIVALSMTASPGFSGAAASHRLLLANALAQAQVLAVGAAGAAGAAGERPEAAMPGGRPVTLITMDRLTPESLGALIALYEHSTVIAAACLGINPFDQPGVEQGKRAAVHIDEALRTGEVAGLDPISGHLVRRAREVAQASGSEG